MVSGFKTSTELEGLRGVIPVGSMGAPMKFLFDAHTLRSFAAVKAISTSELSERRYGYD